MITTSKYRSQQGFTIVEFMVATMVFSVVLLATTAAILHISRIYQRSIHQSNTQAATRSLVDAASQAVQFSSGTVTQGGTGATLHYCAGNKQILYVLGRQVSTTGVPANPLRTFHGAIFRPNNNCASTDIRITNISNDVEKELLGNRMRLVNFQISNVSGSDDLYTVTARVAYGDDDLLCSPAVPGSCNRNSSAMSQTNLLSRRDLQCKPGTGSEYCAVSELTTTVQRRL